MGNEVFPLGNKTLFIGKIQLYMGNDVLPIENK